ncbi:ribonuclease P protein component [Cellvibrio sp. UBA7661]|uniref:ribonuclease P protein component n=1 Tax=Cellvibrio sp. UBA7661 TaxID=1946311 RepID=UPI002F358457
MPAKIEFQQPASSNQTQSNARFGLDSKSASSRFTKSLRLLCAADFKPVFDDAPFRASHQFFLILARENQLTQPRLGLVMAKKHIRLAVERNRMKRLTRESFRLYQQDLAGLDIVVLSRKGMDSLSNTDFNQQLNQQWQRIFKKVRHHRLTSQPRTSGEPINADTKTTDE